MIQDPPKQSRLGEPGRGPACRVSQATKNLGTTSLKRKKKGGNPMREFDRLPGELRAWLASAVLPWRPGSVRRAFDKAVAQTRDPRLALAELDRLEARLVAKDVHRVWGRDHPQAEGVS